MANLGGLAATLQQFQTLVLNVGYPVAAAQFPLDFDYYLFSLQLTDSQNVPQATFIFPIGPEGIYITEPTGTNVKFNNQGVTSLLTNQFLPSKIGIRGSFGRDFKKLVDRQFPWPAFVPLAAPDAEFSFNAKTGYGCIQLLRSLINNSRQLDALGRPYRLYLTFLGFNLQYLVDVVEAPTWEQDLANNMIWRYNLTFTALADARGILTAAQTKDNLAAILSANALQTAFNTSASIANAWVNSQTAGALASIASNQ